MDIMNIMKVSSSKFAFSLIAFAALLGSGLIVQDSYALAAPEFTATHLNTTATLITFDQNVNGTLSLLDWSIKGHSCASPCTTNSNAVAGGTASDYAISNVANATSAGVGRTAPSAGDIAATTTGSGGTLVSGLGYINTSKYIVLIHAAIPSDATYFVNYTNNPATNSDSVYAPGALLTNVQGGVGAGATQAENGAVKYLKIGSNDTAVDWMVPSVTSAEILKSNPSQVRVLMSEKIVNVNATYSHFNFTTSGGGNDAIAAGVVAGNNTDYLYVNLQNPANISDVLTLTYTTADTYGGLNQSWITDAIDTTQYPSSGAAQSAEWILAGHGNKMANFTVSITNWLETGMYGNDSCYDCSAPIVTEVQVSLDGSTPITVTDDNEVQINAGNGDTVSVMVTIADNVGADTMTFAGLYTNFGSTPDNLYYANNFDSFKQMSTSYYEWNARSDDVAFGNTDAITWDAATATLNPDRTQTITYTMTINDSIESTQVWVDLGDKVGNYAKSALPITLEVAGPPAITFASDDSQKVVSYFNESILLAIVSQWTATSSNDATNVEQLSSVLGIEDQLPTWTTSLASWVSDDKIDVADMIVAVEYVINQ